MKLLLATALLMSTAPALAAGNLVANGSFETGDFTGWTPFGDTDFNSVEAGEFVCCTPTDGIYQAVFGPSSDNGGISQAITSELTRYSVSFDMGNFAGLGNTVEFGGVTLLSNIANQAFVHYHFNVTTAINPTLTFSFFNPPSYYNLDNVVVGSGVPEASIWAMLIAGFGLAGAAMRRRRTASAA